MKRLLIVIMLMTTLSSIAQSDYIQDSLDLIECKKIIKDLFEGKLYKNEKIQTTHLPEDYYWCETCVVSSVCCNPFEDTYMKHLDLDLRNNMFSGDLSMSTKKQNKEKFIMLHWIWFDMNNGEYDEVYFHFYTMNKSPIRILSIRKSATEYWIDE